MPTGLERGGDRRLGGVLRAHTGVENSGQGLVVELVAQPIGADEQPVAALGVHCADVGNGLLVQAGPQRPGDDVLPGIAAGLSRCELTGVDERLNLRMVAGHLGEDCVTQKIDA